jgi:hypothetical protein
MTRSLVAVIRPVRAQRLTSGHGTSYGFLLATDPVSDLGPGPRARHSRRRG